MKRHLPKKEGFFITYDHQSLVPEIVADGLEFGSVQSKVMGMISMDKFGDGDKLAGGGYFPDQRIFRVFVDEVYDGQVHGHHIYDIQCYQRLPYGSVYRELDEAEVKHLTEIFNRS